MRLLDAAFDVLRRAGEPLSPSEIVRHIRSARIPIDSKELLDDETVKIELEHVTSEGAASSGIVQTPSGRFTLQSMLDRTIRTGTSIATTASTINPIGIASAIARANVGAMWTVQSATKEALRRAKHPLSISEMTSMLRAAGVLRGARSDNESQVRSQLIQDMLQNGRESTFVRVGNNTYGLRYYPNESANSSDDKSEVDVTGYEENEPCRSESTDSETYEPKSPTRTVLRDAVISPSRSARDIVDRVSPTRTQETDSDLLRRIRTLTNQSFERFIVVFLASIGMTDVVVLNRMHPGELDIRATMSVADVMEISFTLQVLNWHRDVHGGDIQLLRGGMRIGDHGLIITTSDFQRGAIDEANRRGAIQISMINGKQLVKIAKERGAARILRSE